MRLLVQTFPANLRAQRATGSEQVRKLEEEFGEYMEALRERDTENEVEELLDLLIAADNLLDKYDGEAVRQGIAAQMLKGRERGDW